MTDTGGAGPRRPAHVVAADAARAEQSMRARWEARQAELRDRFDEPIARATELTRTTLAWFPVRVWRHFLQHNGFLLAAGVSYQALFAIFAGIYLAFAIVGLWLGGSAAAINGMVDLVNGYIPGLIGEQGIITETEVRAIAESATGVFGVTGAIALVTLVWTAIGWVTFSRRAVRDIFGLPPDRRSYALLKARDLIAALVFGVALILGAAVNQVSTWALGGVFALVGWSDASAWYALLVRVGSVAVALALNTATLAALFRFLAGTALTWRRIWPGSLLGGAGVSVLQFGAGLLVSYAPANPLLATFAIFIGLLLWFRLVGIVTLVAAAWIAVAAADRDVPLLAQSQAQRLADEHRRLLAAAELRVRTAREAREAAPWWRVWQARRAERAARDELAEVAASTPFLEEMRRPAPTGRVGGGS